MRRLLVVMFCAGCRMGFDPVAAGDAGADVDDAAPAAFTVGGTITGLTAAGLVLQLDGGESLAIAMDGPFEFATQLMIGTTYDVTVAAFPTNQSCVVANNMGIGVGMVSDVEVSCFVAGACPAAPLTFTGDTTFVLPAGCSSMKIDAYGGGGAGAAKVMGSAGVAGGAGGHAALTLTAQTPGTMYAIAIGHGGTCASTVTSQGGYAGGKGGASGGSGNGGDGAGASSPPGGAGGNGSTGGQPGGRGGNGGYGGGGGGGGGDTAKGSSGGGATTVRLISPAMEYVVAGGGGAGGTSDQNGDLGGPGGAACAGYNGAPGTAAIAGNRSGGGGGGGACTCRGGTCSAAPTSTGGAGGTAGSASSCTSAQNGQPGSVVLVLQ